MPHLDVMIWMQSVTVTLCPCSWGTMDYTSGSTAHINCSISLVYHFQACAYFIVLLELLYYVNYHDESVKFIRVGSTKGSGSAIAASVPLGLSATWLYNQLVA